MVRPHAGDYGVENERRGNGADLGKPVCEMLLRHAQQVAQLQQETCVDREFGRNILQAAGCERRACSRVERGAHVENSVRHDVDRQLDTQLVVGEQTNGFFADLAARNR